MRPIPTLMLLVLLAGIGLALSNCGGSAFHSSGGSSTATATATATATPTATPTSLGGTQTGEMFVANSGVPFVGGAPPPNVGVFPPGSNGNAAPAPDLTGFVIPSGAAFDPVSGSLYVSDFGADSVVINMADGNQGVLSGPSSQSIAGPAAVAVDGAGTIYVLNQQGTLPFLQAYPAGSQGEASPTFTISGPNTGMTFPFGVTVDVHGNIFVANTPLNGGNNAILEFQAGACASGTCNLAPVTTIAGSNTQLDNVSGVALDSAGNIWVTNSSGSVLEFTLGSCTGSCNLAPVATITNGLNQPTGIAIDKHDQIYVANTSGGDNSLGTVTVYSPTGTLLATIAGPNTLLSAPVGIAIGATP